MPKKNTTMRVLTSQATERDGVMLIGEVRLDTGDKKTTVRRIGVGQSGSRSGVGKG